MKILIILTSILLSTMAFATDNGYKLDMALFVNGKIVSTPRLIVKAGETGSVTTETEVDKNSFDVIAEEGEIHGEKGILMKFKVSHITKDGSRKLISQPTILSKNGEEAVINIGQNKVEMILKVTATRKTL